jgi:SsrA-binding protein
MSETVAVNRRARHEYEISDTFEAGIVLTGTEIKSIRAGKANLADAYARVEKGEAWLIGAHIAPYEAGNRYNHEPRRDRKLLLHRSEIDQLMGRAAAKGLTVVPLRLYLTDKGRAKVELGLARGKQLHDKRRAIAERDMRRDLERELADASAAADERAHDCRSAGCRRSRSAPLADPTA